MFNPSVDQLILFNEGSISIYYMRVSSIRRTIVNYNHFSSDFLP